MCTVRLDNSGMPLWTRWTTEPCLHSHPLYMCVYHIHPPVQTALPCFTLHFCLPHTHLHLHTPTPSTPSHATCRQIWGTTTTSFTFSSC